jgi:hypothetical protein
VVANSGYSEAALAVPAVDNCIVQVHAAMHYYRMDTQRLHFAYKTVWLHVKYVCSVHVSV